MQLNHELIVLRVLSLLINVRNELPSDLIMAACSRECEVCSRGSVDVLINQTVVTCFASYYT